MTLNVLVLENEPDAAADATRELQDAGHTVLTCHDSQTAAFPCRGIVDPSSCPLRSHAVDVALVVRVGMRAQPTLGEDGARCALVHRVPLVAAGAPLFDPFDDYATRTIDSTDGIVTACQEAVAAPVVTAGLHAQDALAGGAAATVGVTVTRRAGHLFAHMSHERHLTPQERSTAAARVVAALREVDPYVSGIDVSIDG